MKMIYRLKQLLQNNSLYRNSIYLIAGTAVSYLSGFLFWIIVTRSYSVSDVGTATALFSLVSLISSLSLLGFNTGLLHYLPSQKNINEKISSSIIVTTLASFLGATSVLLLVPVLFKPLIFISENFTLAGLFILFTVIATLTLLSDSIFIAFRSARHVLVKTVIQSVTKLLLPLIFVSLGAFGIFTALSLGAAASLIYASVILVISFGVVYQLRPHYGSVREMAFLSFGTYISGLINIVPSFLLPLLITVLIGPTATAYYFIAATTANALFMIPQVITQNLLVEGSFDEGELKKSTSHTSRLLMLILIPGVLLMILFGENILIVFGKQYSLEGIMLLKLMSLSAIVVGLNYIMGIFLTIYHHIKMLILINLAGTVSLLLFSWLFLKSGITGIGYATLITQILLFFIYWLALRKVKKSFLIRYLF